MPKLKPLHEIIQVLDRNIATERNLAPRRFLRDVKKTLVRQQAAIEQYAASARHGADRYPEKDKLLESISLCAAAAQDLIGDLCHDGGEETEAIKELAHSINIVDLFLTQEGYPTLLQSEEE